MSFREVRSFTETMRILGYPHMISMESFRNPNVELVADCLHWLIKRYDPSADIVYEIERESDRVFFFKQVCEVALAKGRIKLNPKKLYKCDGHAVREMLKLANTLKKAMQAREEDEPDFNSLQQMAAQKNAQDAKSIQQLCSQLTSDGSELFFLVEKEINQRTERQRILSRATEVGEFERRLRDLLSNVNEQVENLQVSITNLSADESNLEQKIENKKTQLERAQKRLKSLLAVRPAFMEEYDRHAAELHSQFVLYLEQYRNLEYLEHELVEYNKLEDAILEEQETKLKIMRERLCKEELSTIRGEQRGKERDYRSGMEGADNMNHDKNNSGRYPMQRNAAIDGGSSASETDEEDESEESPARPQNAMGRSRPSPTTADRPSYPGNIDNKAEGGNMNINMQNTRGMEAVNQIGVRGGMGVLGRKVTANDSSSEDSSSDDDSSVSDDSSDESSENGGKSAGESDDGDI